MVASLALMYFVSCSFITGAGGMSSVGWCYYFPSCNESTWPMIAEAYCSGTHQSPIDIKTAYVQANDNLTSFNFAGYSDAAALSEIRNTGKEVKVLLNQDILEVYGGALPGLYKSKQFHIHWGNGSSMPGSEHTIDGKRYPMELHIVNLKEGHKSTADALADPVGLTVFAFFIEATNDSGKPSSWKTLTSYLANISNAGDNIVLTHPISLDSLLGGVNRSRYYRYLGSLTTPNCNEGVIWTVFKEPIKVSQDLIDLFSTSLFVNTSSDSPLITNVFRHTQPLNGRIVTSQVGGTKAKLSLISSATKLLPVFVAPFLLAFELFMIEVAKMVAFHA